MRILRLLSGSFSCARNRFKVDWEGTRGVYCVFLCARKRLEVDQQLEVNKDKELDSVWVFSLCEE